MFLSGSTSLPVYSLSLSLSLSLSRTHARTHTHTTHTFALTFVLPSIVPLSPFLSLYLTHLSLYLHMTFSFPLSFYLKLISLLSFSNSKAAPTRTSKQYTRFTCNSIVHMKLYFFKELSMTVYRFQF